MIRKRSSTQFEHAGQRILTCVRCSLVVVFCLLGSSFSSFGQKPSPLPKKLPSAEKIVDNYLKAIGGKKRIGAIKDATYEWVIQLKDQSIGTARTKRKPPSSERWELLFGNGVIVSATNSTSAWEIGLDNQMHTLTGPESSAAKVHALLDSSRLVNYKKLSVLARVVSLGDLASEPA